MEKSDEFSDDAWTVLIVKGRLLRPTLHNGSIETVLRQVTFCNLMADSVLVNKFLELLGPVSLGSVIPQMNQ